MSAPLIQNTLYPGEDADYVHRCEVLQGPEDPQPGQPFDPPQYFDFTNWTSPTFIDVRPPKNRMRRTRLPMEYGPVVFQMSVGFTGPRTEGRVVIFARADTTQLAQDYDELFAELWLVNPLTQRKHMANIRFVVERSVDPTP